MECNVVNEDKGVRTFQDGLSMVCPLQHDLPVVHVLANRLHETSDQDPAGQRSLGIVQVLELTNPLPLIWLDAPHGPNPFI